MAEKRVRSEFYVAKAAFLYRGTQMVLEGQEFEVRDAKVGDQIKTIRFGQQGVSGSPKKEGESAADKARRESFKARHAENIAKGKMSAAYWADKEKW